MAANEYESIEYYFQQICQITEQAASSASDRVGAQAYEFWTTLAEIENSKIERGQPLKNYIGSTKTQLLQLIFMGLLKINFEEDEDDDDWGHALSAACCLQAMSQLLKNEVMDPVVLFVSQNI